MVAARPTYGLHDEHDERMATMTQACRNPSCPSNHRAHRALIVGLVCVAIALSVAAPAAAQSWPERVLVSVNGAFQATTNDVSDHFEFERNLETGSTDVDYPVQGGFIFDAGAGYRFWKNLAAGVSVSYFTRDGAASTTSSVPHPFFFNQPREVTGEATGVKRSETAVHVQVMYLINLGERLRLVVSGGPSFFSVEQDLVTEVTVTEAYPFDTATFASAQKTLAKGSAPTFNVGADVVWMLNRRFGVGGLVRFSRASVDLDAPGNRTIPVDAGGVYAGGGIRILF
jgi:Outer membrane protein beta-barrel domain